MNTMLSNNTFNQWADDPKGPVALYLNERLLPVDGPGSVIIPPTYADVKHYGVETLADGRTLVTGIVSAHRQTGWSPSSGARISVLRRIRSLNWCHKSTLPTARGSRYRFLTWGTVWATR